MKVLIAVDDSDVSRKSVAFAGRILGQCGALNVAVTLLHVVESLPEFIVARAGQERSFREVAESWTESSRKAAEKLLAEQKQALAAAGVPAGRIETRCCEREARPESRRVVAALAIIEEMQQGNYEVVVVGRRSTSASVPTLMGGVADKVAREAAGRTVWIVD